MIAEIMRRLQEKLRYAGSRLEPGEWVKRTFIIALATAIVAGGIVSLFYRIESAPALALFMLIVVPLVRYIQLEMEIEGRRRSVEKVLPDLLRVIAANISAGLTPIVAVRTAAKPEFGIISKELKYLTARSMGTSSLEEIAEEIKKRVRSDMLDKVLLMFITSLRSGGDVVKALEASASDIQRIQELQEALVAQTTMYTTFVLFGIVITMPFLLAVSINVVGLMGGITASQQLSYVASYMSIGVPVLSEGFISLISLVVLVGSSLTASILMGIIRTGSRIEGFRYFIPLMIASLAVFYISKEIAVPFIIGVLR